MLTWRRFGQWLADPTARLITLTGPGGAGKTRLALELARTHAAAGASRVLFTALAAVQNSEFVAPAIAEALGVVGATRSTCPGALGPRAPVRPPCWCSTISSRSWTRPTGRGFSDLGRRPPSAGHQPSPASSARRARYAVGPLALDSDLDTASPDDLARSPAVRLFVERVRDVQPDFRLTSANGPTVTAICRRLDALPLALELAAPWIKVLTAEELLGRLVHDACSRPPARAISPNANRR